MKVAIIVPHEGGVEYHRLISPYGVLATLNEDVVVCQINGLKEEHDLAGVDAVVISRELNTNGNLTAALANIKRQCKLIVDVDDYWNLSERHILKKAWKQNKTAEKIQQCIKAADLITCTHGVLARLIKPLNKSVYILPNAVNHHEEQWQKHTSKNPFFTCGWVGGAAHLEDIEILASPMKRLARDPKSTEIAISLCGYSNDDVWNQYEKIMTSNGRIYNIYRMAGMPITEYGLMYDHLTAVMVPLADNQFNRCKSDLKLSEAGIKGKPVIVSHVHPYIEIGTEKNVLFCKEPDDFYRHIKRLHNSPQMRVDYGRALKETILEKRNFILIAEERKQLLESLIKEEAIT